MLLLDGIRETPLRPAATICSVEHIAHDMLFSVLKALGVELEVSRIPGQAQDKLVGYVFRQRHPGTLLLARLFVAFAMAWALFLDHYQLIW